MSEALSLPCPFCGKHNRDPRPWGARDRVCPDCEDRDLDLGSERSAPQDRQDLTISQDHAKSIGSALEEELAEAWDYVHQLTKALTGLTCNGSEFFIRRRGRYIADIPACVDYVRRRDTDNHRHIVDATLQARTVRNEMWEAGARAVYDQWSEVDGWVPWIPGGNSDKQCEARRLVRKAFDAIASSAKQVAGESSRDTNNE